MKTITIKQPWASLIRDGYKEYEFRTWKTSYRGEIYIHAGKGIDKEAITRINKNISYPAGYIIVKATLTDCILVDDKLKQELLQKDEKVYHNLLKSNKTLYAFHLENIKKIKPIPAKGKLSFWEYND
jgi:hypothetical protein